MFGIQSFRMLRLLLRRKNSEGEATAEPKIRRVGKWASQCRDRRSLSEKETILRISPDPTRKFGKPVGLPSEMMENSQQKNSEGKFTAKPKRVRSVMCWVQGFALGRDLFCAEK
ncbi:MAG: hypothetical protein NZ781_10630 [Armatimonadetes bacterium]|nr:hypothetical protein [Armatimonadota bacterium]